MFKKLFVRFKEKSEEKKEEKIIEEKRRLHYSLSSDHEECPICLSKLTLEREDKHDYFEGSFTRYTASCQSGCYHKVHDSCDIDYTINIFDDRFNYYPTHMLSKEVHKRMWDKIDYWVENDRYVMKIMLKD